jgi:uncharacterized protein YecT (DUF1311 family)
MTPDPLSESLSKLENKFQILTELHRSRESTTYLARNLELNRDVTITVVRAKDASPFVNAFASDAEILKTKRHPNVIPVLDGIWLDDRTFALVRARVRGSTLDQTVSAVGTMPQPRIAAALEELTNALIWARDAGVTNRCIEPETFIFQQNTGRVLIGFEPSPLIAGDAETIDTIARTLNGGAPFDTASYIARLGTPPLTSTPKAAMAAEPVATAPVARGAAVIHRTNQGMSFGARVLATFVVIAAIIVGAVLFIRHRDAERLEANARRLQQDVGGDVSPSSAFDTAAAYSAPYPTIVPSVPAPPPPNVDSIGRENERRIAEAKAQARAMTSVYSSPYTPYTPASPYPSSTYPSTTPLPSTSLPTPATSGSTSTTPPAASTTPVDTMVRPRIDSTGRLELLDPCGSPVTSDQAQCLATAIGKADAGINGVFQQLVAALRRQAGVAEGDPDPMSVDELRSAQRHWRQEREESCRPVGAGSAFYGRERSACYTDRSATRKADLERQLGSIP